MTKLAIFSTFTALTLMVGVVSPVSAQELTQEQKLEQELKIDLECTTGAYGQLQSCKASGNSTLTAEQKQKARMILGSRTETVLYHQPINAGMDPQTMGLVATTLIAGLAGAAYQIKSRIG